jgi:hypothetical protein
LLYLCKVCQYLTLLWRYSEGVYAFLVHFQKNDLIPLEDIACIAENLGT